MAINTVQDLLRSLGHKGAAPEPIPVPAAVPQPTVSKVVQDPKSAKVISKSKSKWAALEAKYQRYDTSNGYGSADEWRGTFVVRMGWEQAERLLNGQSPRELLGLSDNAQFCEIKAAYRKAAMEWHPDRVVTSGKNADEAKAMLEKLNAAYEVLEHEKELAQKLRAKKSNA